MNDCDVIVLNGSPGSGKSTLARLLHEALDGPPLLEFSTLRQPHLDATWSNASPAEEDMAFESLVFILTNYLSHGYRNVITLDFTEERLPHVLAAFQEHRVLVVTLVVEENRELERRIREREYGFTDVEAALAWNRREQSRPVRDGEMRLDTSRRTPEETAAVILEHLGRRG